MILVTRRTKVSVLKPMERSLKVCKTLDSTFLALDRQFAPFNDVGDARYIR